MLATSTEGGLLLQGDRPHVPVSKQCLWLGLPCPQHKLLQQPPWGEGLVSAPDGTQDFLDGLSPTSCRGSTAVFSGFVDAHILLET